MVTQKPHSSVIVVFSTNYEPFGVQFAASGSDPSVKYTGEVDQIVGLYSSLQSSSRARYTDGMDSPLPKRWNSSTVGLGRLCDRANSDSAAKRNSPPRTGGLPIVNGTDSAA